MDKERLNLEAAQVHEMTQTPGWGVLVDEAKERIAKLTKALIWSDDDNQKRELQANIRSLEFLLSFPNELREAAKRLNEQEAQDDPDPNAQ